jgi:hypothetical protein
MMSGSSRATSQSLNQGFSDKARYAPAFDALWELPCEAEWLVEIGLATSVRRI